MKKKYLITGGTGFLGRALVSKLLDDGFEVVVYDNDSRGSSNKLTKSKNVKVITGDIRDLPRVDAASRGIDVIVHLAFVNGTENFYKKPDEVLDVAVKGMSNILEVAIKRGVEELFLASSSEVYNNPSIIPTPEEVPLIIPDPYNPRYSYSGGKIINELMAINSSKNFKRTVIFRPHNVYGPDMGYEHVIPQLLMKFKDLKEKNKNKLTIQGDGNQSRSFIYIDDFTEGLMILLNKGSNLNTYNIGTTDEIKIYKLIRKISEILNYKVEVIKGELTKGSPARRCPDIDKISKLGFYPGTPLEIGLSKTADWYMQ